MARRASAKHHPGIWVAAILLALLAAGGGYSLFAILSDPFRTVQPLPVSDYLEDAISLQGNTYKVEGAIEVNLGSSSERGRLYSVEVTDNGVAAPLPVLVPAVFNAVNIHKGQRFIFKVEIGDKGLISVLALEKK